jgi:nuclear mRNA export protein PCID2/THP1
MGNEEMDLDEIECIVANLIFQGKVKGYISHQKRILIVSKADPFPRGAVVKAPPSPSR